MKNVLRYIFLTQVIIFSSLGCKNNTTIIMPVSPSSNIILFDKEPEVIQSNIQGDWKLEYSLGGFVGIKQKPSQTFIYTFKPNSLTLSIDGKMETPMSYSWLKEKYSDTSNGYTYLMDFKSNYTPKLFFHSIVNDTLQFSQYNTVEGFTFWLSRIK